MIFTFEPLERRQLLAGDFEAGFALPYVLDFNRSKTGLLDRDGSGTGFTWAQPNVDATEYSANRINLKIGVGVLHLYATDDNANTTNLNGANTLKNILTARFSASSKAFVISARLNGPFPQLTAADEQGGILFGPDQDNYVKLVIGSNGGSPSLQFLDEQKFKTGFRRQLPSSFYNIAAVTGTLDLYLVCDPAAGTVRAMYRIDSGDVIELPNALTLTGDKKSAFFSPAGFAGVMVQNHNAGTGIEMSYEQFAVQRGVLEPTPIVPPQHHGQISVPSRKIFNDVRGSTGQSVTTSITNTGDADLHVSAINVTGGDASPFGVTGVGTLPKTIAPGGSLAFTVTFSATAATPLGIKTANVTIASDDPNTPSKNIRLRGLATNGQGGSNEPSLQRVMDLYEIPINVGDSNPNDYLLDNPPVGPNDEVDLQRMIKAGAGNVTIQMLAAFGVGSSTTPTTLFGYYPSGTPSDEVQLLSLQGTGAATQTVSPAVVGNTSFDPGAGVFSLYMRFPSMYPTVVQTQGGTNGFGEDILNQSYDPNAPRKIRFYTFKDSAGNVVPNSYVFTGEDLNAAYDTQDFVGVISNVTAASAGANIGFTNGNGAPFGNRLVFNRITNVNPTAGNVVHNVGNLIVTNSGSGSLDVSNVAAPSGWSLTAGGTSFSIAPGGTKKLTLQFTGSGTGAQKNKLFAGDLVLTSNDPNHPTAAVQLAGFWQKDSENNEEPTLPQIVNNILGYTTTLVGPGQVLSNGGKVEAVGDEVLSPFWLRSDPSLPVSVLQYNAFHTQGNTAIFKWYPQGSSNRNVLFTQEGFSSQSFFPLSDMGDPSGGSFNPGTSPFALKVDGEGSDDATNVQDQPGGGYGHHVRFWPVKDRSGNLIPNTYIMALDYAGINYDYNDNVYLVTNMKPQSANGAVPQSLAASMLLPASSSASGFSATSIDVSDLLDSLTSST